MAIATSILESVAVYVLVQAYIWKWQYSHPKIALVIVLLLLLSHVWHHETPHWLGFRVDNLAVSRVWVAGLLSKSYRDIGAQPIGSIVPQWSDLHELPLPQSCPDGLYFPRWSCVLDAIRSSSKSLSIGHSSRFSWPVAIKHFPQGMAAQYACRAGIFSVRSDRSWACRLDR